VVSCKNPGGGKKHALGGRVGKARSLLGRGERVTLCVRCGMKTNKEEGRRKENGVDEQNNNQQEPREGRDANEGDRNGGKFRTNQTENR